MKYLHLAWMLLALGLIVRCAPTASQSNLAGVTDANATVAEVNLVTTTNTPTSPIFTATPTATHTPTLQASSIEAAPSNSTVTPTKIRTVTPTNTGVFQPSVTPTPSDTANSQPITSPTIAATGAVSAVSTDREAQVKYGEEVYKRLYCGLCHKLDAVGTAGTFGPPHNDMRTIAEQRLHEPHYTGEATTAAEYLYESIVDPRVFIVPGYENPRHQMPIYNFLNGTDVDALVQMLLQQK